MAKQIKKEIPIQPIIKINGIELMRSFQNYYPNTNPDKPEVFSFDVTFEQRVTEELKLLFCVLSVNIHSDKTEGIVGGITVSCVFSIDNFSDLIKLNQDGLYDVPLELERIFNNITFSTTRGMMFNIFKGTILGGAILPISDLSTLKRKQSNEN
jgi:hypothetical protein